jgi:hypothetical protein
MTSAIRAATAVYGGALAIAIAPALQRTASPGDLPGHMASNGLSPSGPPLQFAALLAGVLLFALLGGPIARLAGEKRWVIIGYCIAVGSAPLTLMHFGTWRHVMLHGVVAAGILAARRLEPRFSRHDAVLLPTLLSCYFAFLDLGFGKQPLATFLRAVIAVLALRLIVGAISRIEHPGLAFALSPLALLFQLQWLEPRPAAVMALIWIATTPFAAARLAEGRLKRFAAYVAYPLVACLYPLALLGVTTPPVVDFFEDAHNVLPASEMFRGERPYRDIVPMHGFISDGGLDLLAMKLGATSLGPILRTRLVVGTLAAAAIYFVALAATGMADAALLAVFLALALFPSEVVWLRVVTALMALACCVAGTRLRERRWFLAAGALAALTLLVSLDFAIYTGAVALIAALRARALRLLAAGAAAVSVVALLLFAIAGVAVDFVRVTVTEVLTAGAAYLSAPAAIPDCLRSATTLVDRFSNPDCLAFVIWCVALIGSATMLARSPLRARRNDAVWYVGLWMVFAALSFIERRHLYFAFGAAAFVAGTLPLLARRSRTAAAILIVVLVFLARPFLHIFDVATPLRSAAARSDWLVAKAHPRIRGARVDERTRQALRATEHYVYASLHRDETFFDFANAGLLYYLFDRDDPVRHIEVGMYERQDLQREVIAAIERNPRVRAALITFPSADSAIDGVPNRDRAPLVWRYLQDHFEPVFSEEGVVFWRRLDNGLDNPLDNGIGKH